MASIGLMYAIVLAGFWPFYAGLIQGGTSFHWIIHVHAAVFSGWMILFGAQVGLVRFRRTRIHRRLGILGIYYAGLVVSMGLAVTFVATSLSVRNGTSSLDQAAGFLVEPLGDMLLFTGFFATAIFVRRRTDLHRRLMVLATVALLYPAAARLSGHMGVAAVLATWLAPLGLIVVHEAFTRRRVDRVYVMGTAILLLAFARIALSGTEAWLVIGRWLLGPFVQG